MTAIIELLVERFVAYFSEALRCFQLYFADSFYPILFVVSLALIFFHPNAKKERSSLLWPNLAFLALTFFPPTIYLLMKMVGILVYWRVFWMLTFPIVIAYAITQWVHSFSRQFFQTVAVLIAVVAIIFSGQLILSEEYFTERENYYKLPAEVLEVADIISEQAEEQGIESPKAAVPEYLCVYIRQYDASIRLAYGRNMVKWDVPQSGLYSQINRKIPQTQKLVKHFRKAECNYLVLRTSLSLDEALYDYSIVKVGETETYTIYFDEESTGS